MKSTCHHWQTGRQSGVLFTWFILAMTNTFSTINIDCISLCLVGSGWIGRRHVRKAASTLTQRRPSYYSAMGNLTQSRSRIVWPRRTHTAAGLPFSLHLIANKKGIIDSDRQIKGVLNFKPLLLSSILKRMQSKQWSSICGADTFSVR